jgi:hypothetical protein
MHDNENVTIVEKNYTDNPNITDINNYYTEIDNIDINEDNENNIDSIQVRYELYSMGYTVKQLNHICEYYSIKKKGSKEQIIMNILEFEDSVENMDIVYQRKKMWNYIEALKLDKYLSKFITI